MSKISFRKFVVALLPRSYILKSVFPDGTTVCGENRAGFGGRGVFIFGENLEYELALLPKLLGKGETFIDVGANVGAFSMRAASVVGATGTVLALEPFPRMADMLLENARRNNFCNIRLRVCCASDKVGDALFWMKDDLPNSFTLVKCENAWSYNVPTVTIDALVDRESLKPNLIKIDAEGAENAIIDGARQTLLEHRPALIVEDFITKEPFIPDGYMKFRFKDSHNLVFVHKDSLLSGRLPGLGFSLIPAT